MLNSASLSLSLPNCVINGCFLNYLQQVSCAETSVDASPATQFRAHAKLCQEADVNRKGLTEGENFTFCFLLLGKPLQYPPTQV